ncbi:tagaturonate reductase [Lachnotalea sp. AF33-28]|jgi:tagaturonate reductase|uniref:tagaturonate reductase n=1 Tax=Lachnotalea sp. AF33-28 TaxID=2292046 RepID=UPI000E527385|nr:tagaturonate reductase [Lachnotalea sp. AF33-28]RHP34906.1 tagaturonate reductase [Lachnotalea sp. AF33-28]
MSSQVKETVMQFGEGGFLRAFIDYFFHKMNVQGVYDGKVVIIQPIEKGMVDMLNAQDCKYNLFLRGVDNGQVVNERTYIESVSRAINPYTDFDSYMALAENPDLRVIISNTTEAGIEYLGTEKLTDRPAKSYPAKLTQFLYKRFQTGLNGFILLPCELTDHNADLLRECVNKYAKLWELGEDFEKWLKKENTFCNTLVDRIVTGYPRDEVEELTKQIGYKDNMIDTGEIFHLWVIEGHFEEELPFNKAGINVVWTDNVDPYKKRKVRILNGAHTSMVLGAYLYGLETVGECLKDETVCAFLKKCIFEEIVPTLGNTETDIKFGEAVLERFSNPFIKHMLLSIALNSVSKFQVRVLPTILEYKEQNGVYPPALTFSMAALIAFYRTDKSNDVPEVMEFMKGASVEEILKKEEYWQSDLTDMIPDVQKYYDLIEDQGMKAAYAEILKK